MGHVWNMLNCRRKVFLYTSRSNVHKSKNEELFKFGVLVEFR